MIGGKLLRLRTKWEHDVCFLNLFIVLSDLPYYNTNGHVKFTLCPSSDHRIHSCTAFTLTIFNVFCVSKLLLTIISVGCEVVVRWMAEVDHFLSLIVIAYN
ncbi:Thiazole synthase [Trichinella pseudospiralis]